MNNIDTFYRKKRLFENIKYNCKGTYMFDISADGKEIKINLSNDACRHGIMENEKADLLEMIKSEISDRDNRMKIETNVIERLEKSFKDSREQIIKDLGIEILDIPAKEVGLE